MQAVAVLTLWISRGQSLSELPFRGTFRAGGGCKEGVCGGSLRMLFSLRRAVWKPRLDVVSRSMGDSPNPEVRKGTSPLGITLSPGWLAQGKHSVLSLGGNACCPAHSQAFPIFPLAPSGAHSLPVVPWGCGTEVTGHWAKAGSVCSLHCPAKWKSHSLLLSHASRKSVTSESLEMESPGCCKALARTSSR